ncbi:MAG: hypothetical protein WC072_05075 [Methanoregulaceae archaeon]|jgi:uncharacterized membrane protein
MEVKTIHKTLAGVWALVLAGVIMLFLLAAYFSATSNYQASTGLGFLLLSVLQMAVFYLAPLTFIIVAALFVRDWWMENRRCMVIEKRAESTGLETELRALRQSVETMEGKINRIEDILEKVSD